MLTVSLLAVGAAVVYALIGLATAIHRARRNRAERLSRLNRKRPDLSREQLEQAVLAFFRARTHYEMRHAVDALPVLRSNLILSGGVRISPLPLKKAATQFCVELSRLGGTLEFK